MSKREELREKRRKQEQRKRTALIILVSLIAVAIAAGFILPGVMDSLSPVGPITEITPNPRPNADRNSMGDPNAPVKVEEFSDFQCPFCRDYAESFKSSVVKDYVESGKVYFTYRTFKVIGNESDLAAQAAYCAADQNKFWEYQDILFANQGAENSGQINQRWLSALAEKVGLNVDQFDSCFNTGKYRSQVNSDQAAGIALGVNSTPSFAINGKLIEFQRMNEIDEAITAAVESSQ